jgi:hypothetical protein
MTLAAGAAALQGSIVSARENAQLPPRLRVHLTPAETSASDDVLRYYETVARTDGSFALTNLAPGKYWLLARQLAEDESPERAPRPLA